MSSSLWFKQTWFFITEGSKVKIFFVKLRERLRCIRHLTRTRDSRNIKKNLMLVRNIFLSTKLKHLSYNLLVLRTKMTLKQFVKLYTTFCFVTIILNSSQMYPNFKSMELSDFSLLKTSSKFE